MTLRFYYKKLTSVQILIIMMGLGIALCTYASPLGLVLSGGGAKGAYEVGVWQALNEAGLTGDVAAVSGTSIGAVNAALFASWPDPKGAERLWLENLGKVFVPNGRILQMASERKFTEFLSGKLQAYAEIAGISVTSLPEDSRRAIELEARGEFTRKGVLRDITVALTTYQDTLVGETNDGLCDGTAMRIVLEESLPKNWPRATPRVYVMALANDNWQTTTFCLNEGSGEDRILRLLASTAIPVVFPPVVIDGAPYVDGGWEARGGDNVPLKPILEHHSKIKTVIVVYLDDERNLDANRRSKNREAAIAADVRLVEIIPSENINGVLGFGGVFDTSPVTAHRLIDLGRKDAHEALKVAGLGKVSLKRAKVHSSASP